MHVHWQNGVAKGHLKMMSKKEDTQKMVDMVCMTKKQKRKQNETIRIDTHYFDTLDYIKTFATEKRFLPIPLLCWKCLYVKQLIRQCLPVDDVVDEVISYITYTNLRWILDRKEDDYIAFDCIGAIQISHNVRDDETTDSDSDNEHATKRYRAHFAPFWTKMVMNKFSGSL